jgi:hypothetical protein
MIDCFDGMVVSQSIETYPDAELVNTMLKGAVEAIATPRCRSSCSGCGKNARMSSSGMAD